MHSMLQRRQPCSISLEGDNQENRREDRHHRWQRADWEEAGDPAAAAGPQARYFGAALDDRGLNPDGIPRVGPTRFETWIGGRVSQA